jgi:CheY-like chemotaxis protein
MRNGAKVVLVVDDEPFINERICENLSRMGYVTIACRSLREAWDLIWSAVGKASAIDLVIQDGSVSSGYTLRDGTKFSSDGEKLPCTLKFICELKESGYTGPILANSSSPDYNREMMKAGATHSMDLMSDRARPWNAAQKILDEQK